MRPKTLKRSQYGLATAQFLDLAYKDYLAARVLINAGLLVQGAVLASTAIEKYFKAVLAFRGNHSRGHLKNAHINAVKDFDPDLASALNEEFLVLLRRAYSLRYLDDIALNFNLVIASREFLAELDFSAALFQEGFTLKQGDTETVLAYHEHKRLQDPRLVNNNFLFPDIGEPIPLAKQRFISAERQLVYEVRQCELRGLAEVWYETLPMKSDGKFLRPAYVPLDAAAMSYQLAFKPFTT